MRSLAARERNALRALAGGGDRRRGPLHAVLRGLTGGGSSIGACPCGRSTGTGLLLEVLEKEQPQNPLLAEGSHGSGAWIVTRSPSRPLSGADVWTIPASRGLARSLMENVRPYPHHGPTSWPGPSGPACSTMLASSCHQASAVAEAVVGEPATPPRIEWPSSCFCWH
jgi:hypothetical protein